MTQVAEKIEQEFGKLPPPEQVELYDRLGSLVYGDAPEDPAFLETLRRRVAEMESGTTRGKDAFEVAQQLENRFSS